MCQSCVIWFQIEAKDNNNKIKSLILFSGNVYIWLKACGMFVWLFIVDLIWWW